MDIKEIALKIAEESGAVGYSPAPLRAVRGYSFTYEQLQNFAEALIESYKAELLKEAGEPVGCRYKDHNGHWCFMDKQYGNNEPLYTPDQLAIAIAKATKPLEDEVDRLNGQISVYRLSFVELERQRNVEMASATQWATGYHELRTQLAAAQEENGRLENQVLARDAELWGRTQEILGLKDQLAKAEQLWQIAQGRCDGLEEKLAKAEQRVVEACRKLASHHEQWAVSHEIEMGEWRKFVKEVK